MKKLKSKKHHSKAFRFKKNSKRKKRKESLTESAQLAQDELNHQDEPIEIN